MENNEAEEDPGMKPEGEEETKSSAGKDAETSSGVGGADQLVGYIVHFANAVQVVSEEKLKLFWMW